MDKQKLLVSIAAMVIGLIAINTPYLRMAEWRLYDLRLRLNAGSVDTPAPIKVIALDDVSMERMEPAVGRWPWPRAVFAAVVDYVSEASVIGVDMLFPESDLDNKESDLLFAESVEAQGSVIGAVYLKNPSANPVAPYPALAKGLHGFGHVQIFPDDDGVVRRHAANFIIGEEKTEPSMAVAIASRYNPDLKEQLQKKGEFLLCPSTKRPPVYSIADIITSWNSEEAGLDPIIPRDEFKDSIVLIGSLASGLPLDREVTSLSVSEAGVLITATAIQNLLAGSEYRVAGKTSRLLMILAGAFVPFLIRSRKPIRFLAYNLLSVCGYVLAAVLITRFSLYMLPVIGPAVSWSAAGLGCLIIYWTRDRQKRMQLERLEQSKQRFTDMLVHDLRNRLNAATMSIGMLSGYVRKQMPEQTKLADIAQASLQRMLVEVSSLLEIRKMNEGRIKLNKQPVNIAKLLNQVKDEYQTAASAGDIAIEVRTDESVDDDGIFMADRDLLERLFGNLMINALHHARPDSTVVMDAKLNNSSMHISIGNSGPVLTDEVRSILFKPFSDIAGEKRRSGTGLGLALCRLVAEAHEGSVSIDSPWTETGDGVVVCVTVPTGI